MKKIYLFALISLGLFSRCGNSSSKPDNEKKSDLSYSTMSDTDGNVYHTVKIGSQIWMKENLKTSHFCDGSPIEEIRDSAKWGILWRDERKSSGNASFHHYEDSTAENYKKDHPPHEGWCYYNNDPANNKTYGKLYNLYAVIDTRHLCPTGWHVPSHSELMTFVDYLGGDSVAGFKMKIVSIWSDSIDSKNDNSSDFTALPSGERRELGCEFTDLNYGARFWCSDIPKDTIEIISDDGFKAKRHYQITYSFYLEISESDISIEEGQSAKDGYSVRCIKDGSN